MADAYFPAKEEPSAALTVLSRETRATASATERRRTAQTAAAEPLRLEKRICPRPPTTLRDSRGPDGRRAAAAPRSERLHGEALTAASAAPFLCSHRKRPHCSLRWSGSVCKLTRPNISQAAATGQLSPRSARPGQICS